MDAHRTLDGALVMQVDGLFLEILDEAYERPARSEARIQESLRRAAELEAESVLDQLRRLL